jgi:hypothetical protein
MAGMDLRKAILREHSKTQTSRIVAYVGNNKERFKELVTVFLEGPYRVTQRAAWPLTYVVEENPKLIVPHLKAILNFLKKEEIHDAVKRNTIRLLQFIDIPKQHESQVTDLCFQFLTDKKEPIAVRVFAMSVLAQIARKHPDLKKEISVLIEDELPYASAAFVSRGKKVLKQLNTM